MLGIGFGEMILIGGIALVVIGPEKFPDFAKVVLRTVRDLRGYMDDVKQEVTKELNPLKGELKSLEKYRPEEYVDHLMASDTEEDEAIGYSSGYDEDAEESEGLAPGDFGYSEDQSGEDNYREPMPGEEHVEGYDGGPDDMVPEEPYEGEEDSVESEFMQDEPPERLDG